MIVAAIVVCEIAFWVCLAAGLAARYLLRRPRLGLALLLGSPLADLGLLVLSFTDLWRGAPATQAHAVAAVYVAVTIAFGHSLIRWGDVHFAHRFAGGPAPVKLPSHGRQRLLKEWKEFGKFAMAWAIGCALIGLLMLAAGGLQHTEPLWGTAAIMSIVGVFWFIFGPLSATLGALRPRGNPATGISGDAAKAPSGDPQPTVRGR